MSTPAVLAKPPKFLKEGSFRHDLEGRVDAYFAATGKARRDLPAMYSKTAVILLWTAACWAALVFGDVRWWLALPLAVGLGLGVSAIGMAVMHDANHSGYSRWPWVNRLMGWTLDSLGCSSHVWKTKHNMVHHTWTNVVGVDDDLEVGPLARLAPGQRWRPWHRAQHVYMFVLYAFLLPKWVLFDDFYNLATRRVGGTALPAPTPLDWAVLIGGKALFLGWSLAVPMLWHSPLAVVGLWLVASSTVGVVLGTTFQLAHCAQGAEFTDPGQPVHRDWAEHQLATTIDFAPRSRLLTWFVGGLNFQVVHHLFPRVCHLHYPAIAHIVEQTAVDHGLEYHHQSTLAGAVAAHLAWLRAMGQPPTIAAH
ncbi:MAG: acyl-CoA desaturase [Deltaproteobacteria bacterium]|nr:acyl-CoA desaturase [Deltaproteobacteria bacterium]